MHKLILAALLGSISTVGFAAQIRVTVTNLAPANGTSQTPVWVGFHNGMFDIYDLGSPASVDLERIAEDGDTMPITATFGASGNGSAQGTLGSGPFGPGQSVSMVFNLNPLAATSQYLSYASMIVPSNDAFIANGNPTAFQIFSAGGTFLGADFIVTGAMALDSGTEVNDEIPMNTALLGQMVPNTGVNENGVVHVHLGFNAGGNILTNPSFSAADFKATGYNLARITVDEIPEPSTLAFMGVAVAAAFLRRRLFPSNMHR